LEREIERTRRDRTALSVVAGDVDHLREMNAAYGHEGANEALKAIGRIIRTEVRRADLACQMTMGDEMLIILPGVDLPGAFVTGERIRTAVEALSASFEFPVTVSLGCAQLRTDESLDQLIQRADERLYEAKNRGRNRVS
jgi:diguanylate cyclase (GGDEF)-like protein